MKYISDGYDKVYEIFEDIIKECECFYYKSLLQVYVQKYKQGVVYKSTECGEPSNRKFKTKLTALGKTIVIEGINKRENEKEAARQYCIKNNINLLFNNQISVGMIREKKTWNLDKKRKEEIVLFEDKLGIGDAFKGYEYIFDAVLTHVSYYNEKKSKESEEKDMLVAWTEFLRDPESEKVRRLEMNIEEIKEAKDELIRMSNDDKQRELYEMRSKILKDKVSALNEAERKGIEKGIQQRNIEIAKNLLDVLDNETISIKTGLSIEEIEKLR